MTWTSALSISKKFRNYLLLAKPLDNRH